MGLCSSYKFYNFATKGKIIHHQGVLIPQHIFFIYVTTIDLSKIELGVNIIGNFFRLLDLLAL